MKRLLIVLAVLALFGISAEAQMHGGMMGEQKGGVKQQGMMPPMMGDGMMMKDMMQMMMGMMDMQEKMMMGMKPEEKKRMMKDMAQMKEKMHKMMAMHMGMMGMERSQANLKCAEQWLKKAIDLHEMHVKDPKTATEASQHEMMDHMKKAYGCLVGAVPGTSDAPQGQGKVPPATADPHKH